MGNFLRVDEYRREKRSGGASEIYQTGNGMRVNADQCTVIYSAGKADDGDTNVFTVYLTGGSSFITDWTGIQDITNERDFVRVNRYQKVTQEDGTKIWQYLGWSVGSSARVFPDQVVKVYQNGIGYEEDGETDHNIFRVFLADGQSFVTDWDGWQDITNN